MAYLETISQAGNNVFEPIGQRADKVRQIRRVLTEIELELSCRYPQEQDEKAIGKWIAQVQELADEMMLLHNGQTVASHAQAVFDAVTYSDNFSRVPIVVGLEARKTTR